MIYSRHVWTSCQIDIRRRNPTILVFLDLSLDNTWQTHQSEEYIIFNTSCLISYQPISASRVYVSRFRFQSLSPPNM